MLQLLHFNLRKTGTTTQQTNEDWLPQKQKSQKNI